MRGEPKEVGMDLISSAATEITKYGMDGLLERQKAISSNIANVMTPGYHRQEVSFEGQLRGMLADNDNKDYMKSMNSLTYNPKSLTEVSQANISKEGYNILTPQQSNYLNSSSYQGFSPQVLEDNNNTGNLDGNNVELEKEMMDMAKTGTQYTLLSNLERRDFAKISSAIKGE